MLAIIRTILTAYWRNGTLRQFVGLGLLFGLISLVAVSISLGESSKVMTDVRLTGIETIGLLSVIFFVATAWKKARQDHSVHLLLTHYHHRVKIYIAYFLAYVILIVGLYLIMTAVALLTIWLAGHPPLTGFMGAVGLSLTKMIGLTSIAWVLGSIMSGYLASIITLVVYIIGHSTGFVTYYFQRQGNATGEFLGKIIYYLFPNFQALDSHPLLAGTASGLDITWGIIIMITYTFLMLAIGTRLIRHQEL